MEMNHLGFDLVLVTVCFVFAFILKNKWKNKTNGVMSSFLGIGLIVLIKYIYNYCLNLYMYRGYFQFDLKEIIFYAIELFVALEAVNLYNRKVKSDKAVNAFISFAIFEATFFVVGSIIAQINYHTFYNVASLPIIDCAVRSVENFIYLGQCVSYYFDYNYFYYGVEIGNYMATYFAYGFLNLVEVVLFAVLIFAKGKASKQETNTDTNTNTSYTNTTSKKTSFGKRNYDDEVAAIKKYKELYDAGAITKEEFEAKKKQIMK